MRAEGKDALKELTKLEKATAKNPSPSGKGAGVRVDGLTAAEVRLQPTLDRMAAIQPEAAPVTVEALRRVLREE